MGRLTPALSFLLVLLLFIAACSGRSPAPTAPPPPPAPPSPPPPPATWDLATQGVPRFITHNYIELASIMRISRFRSGIGHDYSAGDERCRSMKHYFVPRFGSVDASTIPVYAPVSGEVFRLRQESLGVQVEIKPRDYPSIRPILFHVNATIPLAEGMALEAGQRIGTHIGSQTFSDVAIVVDSTQGLRLVSWFEAITDGLMAAYVARGVASREAAIITRAERDASPLSCNGETFANEGTINNFLTLR